MAKKKCGQKKPNRNKETEVGEDEEGDRRRHKTMVPLRTSKPEGISNDHRRVLDRKEKKRNGKEVGAIRPLFCKSVPQNLRHINHQGPVSHTLFNGWGPTPCPSVCTRLFLLFDHFFWSGSSSLDFHQVTRIRYRYRTTHIGLTQVVFSLIQVSRIW